jgi:hypothetical protein
MENNYVVEVVRYENGEVVKRVRCGASMSRAEKIERGLNIKMDAERFYTRIVEEPNGR